MELFSEKGLLELAEGIDSLTITIKANENFIDILKRVSEEAEKICPDVSQQMSDSEIAKGLETCFNKVDCDKKEKKKKNKKFKVGDVVYWGKREGLVTEVYKGKDEASLYVSFEETGEFGKWHISFTKDGRFLLGTPIVLSHEPYELKMKNIK